MGGSDGAWPLGFVLSLSISVYLYLIWWPTGSKCIIYIYILFARPNAAIHFNTIYLWVHSFANVLIHGRSSPLRTEQRRWIAVQRAWASYVVESLQSSMMIIDWRFGGSPSQCDDARNIMVLLVEWWEMKFELDDLSVKQSGRFDRFNVFTIWKGECLVRSVWRNGGLNFNHKMCTKLYPKHVKHNRLIIWFIAKDLLVKKICMLGSCLKFNLLIYNFYDIWHTYTCLCYYHQH